LLYPNLPLDLIEALTTAASATRLRQAPPLPWWLIEIVYRLVTAIPPTMRRPALGHRSFALVWLTARSMVGPSRAFVAVLIIDGLHYSTTRRPSSITTSQLPFWALAG
jgi:hypothetical protein